ncbi:N-acetylmuramoyl-L-alanine amidase, partial [bacterium]|nr:N-acetylmuramoyl-L-alanine amidase [bacterium]
APVRQWGDLFFVDAFSICDALKIRYHLDTMNRYVFSFPGNPVILIPDGTFAQIGMELVHFPLPVFKDGVRLFVPGDVFLEVLTTSVPGNILVNENTHTLVHIPSSSDLVKVSNIGLPEDNTVRIQFTFTSPFKASLLEADEQQIALVVENARIRNVDLDSVDLGDRIISLEYDREGGRILIRARDIIQGVRLDGPDLGNSYTVNLFTGDEAEIEEWMRQQDETLTSLQEDRDQWKIDKVVIDAGHGGEDPGAIGKGNNYEKKIVLQMAKRLQKTIENRLGIETVMTRSTDTFLKLNERTQIANRVGGKLFISIHCNSARDRRARGQETYFLAPAKSERALEVAKKENSVIQYEDSQDEYKNLTQENFILLNMATSQFARESETFAYYIQRNLEKRTGLRNRGVDQAGFFVLYGASMPAVLVETGFISNPTEEKMLLDASFQEKVAEGICDAILEFIAQTDE